ncbi:hypothetical protein ACJX0J_030090, partial [Zea mays]
KPSLEKGLVSPVMMVLRVEVAVSTRGMPKGMFFLDRTRVIWMSSVDSKTGTTYT